MSDRRLGGLMLAAALTVLLPACATRTVTPGEPEPPPTTTAALQLPPRPAEVPIDDLDPCLVFTPQQRQDLGIDQEPRPSPPSSRSEVACTYAHSSSEPFFSYYVAPVPQEGADAWLTGRRNVAGVAIREVAGFGAVQTLLGGSDDDCSLTIDVAAGQSLDVMFLGDSAGSFTVDEMCERARLGAAAAMETLLAR
ncbi:MAG: DUF3558 domain-containing protein [Pseudonocardiaceae bacterium]